ncbi:hypothetical protein RN001_002290 [Aquatica leii]|uniref:Uncharacterized protein n=1 Tax=Aquatica leii TaxID=1421715 RepID=A0AAN7SLR9_9COLE|nr:hypothetical protein RN001_002290 [Aquatica leii]
MTSRGNIILQALNKDSATASESINKKVSVQTENENSNLETKIPRVSTSSDPFTRTNEVYQEEYDHSDASYDNLFGDNSSDEYVPDPKDYVDSSDDGIAEEQNEPKTKKRCHRIMRED